MTTPYRATLSTRMDGHPLQGHPHHQFSNNINQAAYPPPPPPPPRLAHRRLLESAGSAPPSSTMRPTMMRRCGLWGEAREERRAGPRGAPFQNAMSPVTGCCCRCFADRYIQIIIISRRLGSGT